MKIRKFPKSLIPNSFTAFNVLSGFISIIMASKEQFNEAFAFICIAALCDALDGLMARITKSTSQFGVELDSLADVVSFGAAPAFLLYQSHLYQFDILGMVISAFPICLGAFRLARFNVELEGFTKSFFYGVPIPLSAITLGAFVFNYYSFEEKSIIEPYSKILIPVILIISFLMVSKIKYATIPKFSIAKIKAEPLLFIYLFAATVAVVITKGNALFIALFSGIILGIINHIFLFFKRQKEKLIK